ncbi:ATPdependent RNA helicase [Dermatophagoides pteronyssinus]|uniref:ATP-dependent RNA helicase n=1 Tax=Dermatophagoides pteronyssinus TaxID=6956 RepID=A0ABQ8IX04_DERPT|nr:ATPdependent RNA helicase [Dermatophagoides pteronyssinus]
MSDSFMLGNLNFGDSKSKNSVPPKPPNKQANKFSDKSNFTSFKQSHTQDHAKNQQAKNTFPTFKSSKLFDDSTMNIPELSMISKTAKHEEVFSDKNFGDFNIDKMLIACLQQRFDLTRATKVQSLSIPPLLNGDDALIKSVTGSGKTLAYAIPLVHSLQLIQPKITRSDGLFALIILPTRELAIQTYDCIDRLLNPFRRMVVGILIGGEKKKSEKARIRKGLNILVTTPGRLLDHINRTKNLNIEKLKWLVIDEADRLYEQGFSAIITQIIECIHSSCKNKIQTVLLSATLSEGVKELAGLSLKNSQLIDVGDDEHHLKEITLPSSLTNSFMVVPSKLRLVTLSCIIMDLLRKNGENSKIIVFTSCQDVVDFYSTLLTEIFNQYLESNVRIFKLHGNMDQNSRTEVFKQFHSTIGGILFCTDVASRGLDLPNVDLIIQMSSPAIVEDFVHRVGRTARLGKPGQSILILLPSEIKFIEYLREQLSINFESLKMETYFTSINSLKLPDPENFHTEQERLANLQHLFEKLVWKETEINQLACKAYLSFIRAYASYPRQLSSYLPFRQIHFGHLAKSFALLEPPKELASKLRMNRKVKKTVDIGAMKRKSVPMEERVSEFSGFGTEIKKIRRKKSNVT